MHCARQMAKRRLRSLSAALPKVISFLGVANSNSTEHTWHRYNQLTDTLFGSYARFIYHLLSSIDHVCGFRMIMGHMTYWRHHCYEKH
jgi:hypothetical protein